MDSHGKVSLIFAFSEWYLGVQVGYSRFKGLVGGQDRRSIIGYLTPGVTFDRNDIHV